MKKLIAGNWKMNGSRDEARGLIADIVNKIDADDAVLSACDFLVCPPAIFISDVRHALHSFPQVQFGLQDVSAHEEGAYTGEVSAAMLKDAGCSHVIVGHSERRHYHSETDAIVREKASRALEHGIIPIICVGETLEEREAGRAEEIVETQLSGSIPELSDDQQIVIAYEPVWAIGTGKTASPQDAQDMHAFIRTHIPHAATTRILYGGSMKPDNAEGLLSQKDIDGGLIGGASLKAETFVAIARAAEIG